MKILLDENVTHNLRHEIVGHDCETVAYRGWKGKRNGELLRLAAEAGFDAILTNDTNIPHQQSQTHLPVAIIVLHAASNDINDLLPLVPELLRVLEGLPPNRVTTVGLT